MRRLHLVVGSAAAVAFLLTGQYMDRWLAHLEGMADLPRMLYRSAHIYLLFSALLNLVLGLYLVDQRAAVARGVGRVGSALILIAPVLLLAAFALESPRSDLERPYARLAIYGSGAGVVLHVVAAAIRVKP